MTDSTLPKLSARQAVAEALIADGWTVERSRRGSAFVCLRHPNGGPGAIKLILFRHFGTASLFGGDDGWRVVFKLDVPDDVLLGACMSAGTETQAAKAS